MCLIVLLEFGRFVTLMPIKDKYSIQTLYSSRSILIEVFELFQARLVICLAINCWFNHLVVQKAALSILAYKIILPLNYQKRRDTLTFAINTSNYYRLFPITWLNCLASTTSICASYDYRQGNYAYYKARFVEVVEIGVNNPIFRPYILNQSKPRANKLQIFV